MKVAEILKWLIGQGYEYKFTGDGKAEIRGFSALANYKDKTLTWIKKEENYDALNRPRNISCAVIQSGVNVDFENAITTDSSKEIFFAILHEFWGEKKKEGFIGEGTVISDQAVIDPTVTIGCNCSIAGNVVIGAHTVIEHNVVISHAVIGDNCIIHSGTVIGTDGYGYYFKDDGSVRKVEHFGGVEIGNDVEIGANACIDRGTIDDTVIGAYSKIDNLVHIAHNVHIGVAVCVVAGAVICGSAKLKEGAYIAPGGIVKNQLVVGKDGFVGLGAVVTRSVEDEDVVTGIPARPVRKYQKGDK